MCCLFGMVDYGNCFTGKQRLYILSTLAEECEARGTDATGVAYNSGGQLRIFKRPLPAHKIRLFFPCDANVVMGHTRMATQGSAKKNCNNHPFRGAVGGMPFALAHNGVLRNDGKLRRKLGLHDTRIETDSYIAVQLIERRKVLSFDTLSYMAEQMEGSFTFTVLDGRNSLYFIKGDNPLCLVHFPRPGFYLYASTEGILAHALKKLQIVLEKPVRVETRCGDILKIDVSGRMTTSGFDTARLVLDSWQFPLFTGYPLPLSKTPAGHAEQEYLEELKSVAGAFGLCPEEIDRLVEEGITPEEIEEYLYCGEF
ncbi:hypothetical protein CE91St41_04530 [Oscillospiraceae bacterium]|nr:hypothetical protein CE91St40_04550 [Oscillospiraceae bacterium]BDF73564.1 hypothetical protein CE91St41_04530 [Oscillospiraceae bacterium]